MVRCAFEQSCRAECSVLCLARAPQPFPGGLSAPGEGGLGWRARMGLRVSIHVQRERRDCGSREVVPEGPDRDVARMQASEADM
eukprot:8260100-Alexandrium_andersonii.AAC.1